jgi:hypothetical protein
MSVMFLRPKFYFGFVLFYFFLNGIRSTEDMTEEKFLF